MLKRDVVCHLFGLTLRSRLGSCIHNGDANLTAGSPKPLMRHLANRGRKLETSVEREREDKKIVIIDVNLSSAACLLKGRKHRHDRATKRMFLHRTQHGRLLNATVGWHLHEAGGCTGRGIDLHRLNFASCTDLVNWKETVVL